MSPDPIDYLVPAPDPEMWADVLECRPEDWKENVIEISKSVAAEAMFRPVAHYLLGLGEFMHDPSFIKEAEETYRCLTEGSPERGPKPLFDGAVAEAMRLLVASVKMVSDNVDTATINELRDATEELVELPGW